MVARLFRPTASLSGPRIWLFWVAGSTLGSVIPLLIAQPLQRQITPELNEIAMSRLLLSLGASMGVFQWWVLRPRVNNPVKWIGASGFGFLLASYLSLPLKLRDIYLATNYRHMFQLDEVLYGSAFGFVLGCVQWLVLRSYSRRAGWWIAASTLGWTMSYAIAEGLPLDWNGVATIWCHQATTTAMATGINGIFLVGYLKPLKNRYALDTE